MANIDSRVMVNKDGEPFSGVLKAFSSLLEIYILNLFLGKKRDDFCFINYPIFKAKWFQDLEKVGFLKEGQYLSAENIDI